MDELIKLLKENTKDKGSWTLSFNEYTTEYYVSPLKWFVENFLHTADIQTCKGVLDEYNIPHLTDTGDLYNLHWYKRTPVGFYSIWGTSIEEITEKVKEIVNE